MLVTSKSVFILCALLAAECHGRNARAKFSGTGAVKGTSMAAGTGTATASAAAASSTALNATVLNCFITVPANPLSAQGLATPFLLQPPCSMAVATQQAFVEAAIVDPATGQISIYHPLVSNAGTPPAAAPVVPTLPAGAVVAFWLGFNGGVLQMLDTNGQDANNSPALKGIDCVNGLPGTQGDVFGQVSWCNTANFFTAANTAISSGKLVIPPLGTDSLGNACPTSRSFEIVDACPSDNVPTQYLLSGTATAQDTAANKAAIPNGEVINNASDEALLANIIDPLIGCTPFLAPSLDNPGEMVPALALSELQAAALQQAPIGLVPLNDPDTLLTASGTVSTSKTNAYRLGVNQPAVGTGGTSGALVPYCQDMVSVAPPFFKGFQTLFTGQTTPAANVGNNLFTFMCERYLMSLTQLTCPTSAIPNQPVVCKLDGNGVATSCTITLPNGATGGNATTGGATTGGAKAVSSVATASPIPSVTSSVALVAANTSSVALVAATTSSVALAATTSNTKAAATTAATSTVVIEVITFFIFELSLGSPVPGVVGGQGAFIVLEETFIDLPSAAAAACISQFNACAALAGSAFSGTDCLSQKNSCEGVASTASPSASTPGTVTATATVPASASSAAIANIQAVVSSGSAAACLPVTTTVTMVTSGAASPTPGMMHLRRHINGMGMGSS